ncbi:MAG TPA: potassium channel protein [Caldilineae bacterium]|nr:potassium channel protein [Caldilineae bacterium]
MSPDRWIRALSRLDGRWMLACLAGLFLLSGTWLFHKLEGWNILDSWYFAVVTLTTLGYGDLVASRPITKLLVSVYVILGLGLIGVTAEAFLGRWLRSSLLEALRMERVKPLKDHVVLCRYNSPARIIAQELAASGQSFVIVEADESICRNLVESTDWAVVHGDAREEETLLRAGITEAQVLITTFEQDADNVFTIITARELNPKLRVVSTATRPENVAKLRRVGADEVVAPEIVVGKVLARAAVLPQFTSLLDRLHLLPGVDLEKRAAVSDETGRSVGQLAKEGTVVLAIVRDGRIVQTFDQEEIVRPGDELVVVTGAEEDEL